MVNENIIAILQKKHQLSDSQMKQIQRQLDDGKEFSDVMKQFSIGADEIAQAKAEFFHMPYLDIFGQVLDPEVLNMIPKELALNYKIIPFEFDKEKKKLKIAVVNPGDFKAIEAAEFIARKQSFTNEYHVISDTAFTQAYKQYESLGKEVEEVLDIVESEYQKKLEEEKDENEEDFEEVIKSAPVSKMVSSIMKHAVEGKASDIHIEPEENESRVRYRVDGVLKTSLRLPKHVHNSIVSRLKVMSNLKIDETRVPQDGRIRMAVGDKRIDLRISFLPLQNTEKVVIRILDVSNKNMTLEDLGFWGKGLEYLKQQIAKPNGMILVTGPTGSGKSTTLYSMLNILNQESVNIVTLEDPVEYYLEGVNQSQVNADVGYTFASGLRSILRQDPDIIMVGEIRDNETAELATHAALTGHLVLSTLHTNDAIGAIPRLVDMHIENFLIASTLNIVLAQRLVREICVNCKEEMKKVPDGLVNDVKEILSEIDINYLPEEVQEMVKNDSYKFMVGKGCPHCGDSGYQSRIAIVEALVMTDDLKEVIVNNKMDEVSRVFLEQGLPDMRQDGVIKVLQGRTTMAEVLRATKQ